MIVVRRSALAQHPLSANVGEDYARCMVAFTARSTDTGLPETAADRAGRLSAVQAETRHDAALVTRFKAGDESAFNEIVARYHEKMFSIAFARLRNRPDAEEIAQDVFIRAHRALGNFRGDSSLATWLHRIAVNLALNRYWYFFRRRRHLMTSLDQPLADTSCGTIADLVASECAGPVRTAIAREFSAIASECSEQLCPGHREILHLRNTLNRSYDEIAVQLGLEPGTVKSRIGRARRSLQALMAKACPGVCNVEDPAEWFEGLRTSGPASGR